MRQLDIDKEFPPEALLIFIGHSSDTDEETKELLALETRLNRELELLAKVAEAPKYSRVRLWEWNEDAASIPGGQLTKIEPVMYRAEMGIFLFKERIGGVTWEELKFFRKRGDAVPVLALFPARRPDSADSYDEAANESWNELVKKCKSLTSDWNEKTSESITPLEKYRDTGHLKEIVFERVKKEMPDILKPDTSKENHKTQKNKIAFDKRFDNYKQYALNEHRHLNLCGFETNLRVSIELEHVYINMRANVQSREPDASFFGLFKAKRGMREEQLSALDMKSSIKEAEKRKIKDMVILGAPGSGKTTLLKYVLVMLLEGKGVEKVGISSEVIPFFAPLRELKDPQNEGFLPFMKRICRFEKFGICEEDFKNILNGKQGVILLDGLDEVADEEMRVKTCKWIDDARKDFVYTRFVITSRFAGYLGKSRLEGNLIELSIQDFTPEEVKAFLTRWFQTVEAYIHPGPGVEIRREKVKEQALKLVEEIEASDHVRQLAVNPLLLQIIALIRYDRKTALPARRVELYEECTNVLLEKWDMSKGMEVIISSKQARQILQPVALWLHGKDGRRSATLEEIVEIVKESLKKIGMSSLDPMKLLLNIRDRSGIFMGYSADEYGFTHLSFQEYLTAEQVRNKSDIELLIDNYGDRWWSEVIRLSLALVNPTIIEAFMGQAIHREFFKKDISLVMDAVRDSINKPIEIFVKAVEDMQLSLEARQNALRLLDQIGDESVVEPLKRIVIGEDRALALAAYASLKKLNAIEGVEMPIIQEIPSTMFNEKDGSEMVLIPAATFLYGSHVDDKEAGSNEKPQQTIQVPDFYMDIYPVTNEQYCKFLNDIMPDEENLSKWIYLSGRFQNERCRISMNKGKYHYEPAHAKHPVIYVSWFGASAYAEWAGKRLPSEVEWEKAARGMEGWKYPWGNEFEDGRCNSLESGTRGTSEVGKFDKGKSPYGCHDMAGNVWEWCNDWYDDDNNRSKYPDPIKGPDTGKARVLRGGSWGSGGGIMRCAVRLWYVPDGRILNTGFRCAR